MKAGWELKRLSEALVRTETVNPVLKPEAEFDYIDVSSISNSTYQIEQTQHLKGKDAPSRARKLVRTNDILFATIRPTLRRIAIVPKELDQQICSTGYFVLRPAEALSHKYLYYYLFTDAFMSQMETLQKGASYPAVTDEEVKAQLICCPPLPEQHRIVAILDEAFAGIATATANAKSNLNNARELYESYLYSVLENNQRQCLEKSLAEICSVITDGTHNSPSYVESGIPMLDSKNVKEGFLIDDSKPDKFIMRETDNLLARRCKPRTGDILISSRGTIGKIGIVREGQDFNIMGNMILVRIANNVNRKYVAYFLSSKVSHMESMARGVAQKGLYLNQIRDVAISLPSISEQGKIVQDLDSMVTQVNELKVSYQQKHTALNELKQSILHQAFSGQLH